MKPETLPAREPEEDLIDFPELVRTFGRYKWGIAGLTILAATIAALIAFTLLALYPILWVLTLAFSGGQSLVVVDLPADPGVLDRVRSDLAASPAGYDGTRHAALLANPPTDPAAPGTALPRAVSASVRAIAAGAAALALTGCAMGPRPPATVAEVTA